MYWIRFMLLCALTGILLLSACTIQPIQPDAQPPAAETTDTSQAAGVPPVDISAEMPYTTQYVEVLGAQMAYVDAGEGAPILFLHGNPTSKYLWRNVMPWLEEEGRVIAPDLIGMGESDKPNIDYTFAEHSEYVDAFIAELGLENITLVVHDWGSGLGFDYAARHPDNIRAIAFMEAIMAPVFPASSDAMAPDQAEFFQMLRTPGVGEEMILEQNLFVEQILPGNVVRDLTAAEMDVYRAPYPTPEDRTPVLVWPRQIPIDGEPADVVERVNAYNDWLLSSDVPKLHLYAAPGALNPPQVVSFMQQSMSNLQRNLRGPRPALYSRRSPRDHRAKHRQLDAQNQ